MKIPEEKKKKFLCTESAGMDDWQFVCNADSLEEAEQLCEDYNNHPTSQGRKSRVLRELTQKEIESGDGDGRYEIDHEETNSE
jgi:hypothetical protein